jgi:hypothetical protein
MIVLNYIDRTIPKVFGGAMAIGSLLGIMKWSGGLGGYDKQAAQKYSSGQVIEVEKGNRQGFWEVVHRRPLSQTIDELGDLVKPFK